MIPTEDEIRGEIYQYFKEYDLLEPAMLDAAFYEYAEYLQGSLFRLEMVFPMDSVEAFAAEGAAVGAFWFYLTLVYEELTPVVEEALVAA